MITNKASRVVEFSTLESRCAYLPDRRMRMEYKYIEDCPTLLNQKLVQRGWRRFGEYYSRPNCPTCKECLSLRIDAKNFKFSKSANRTIRKNKDTKIIIQKPTITISHLRLYEKYHRFMEKKKGWKHYEISPNSYHELYVSGAMEFGKEILYFIQNRLVGVDLVDFLPDGISSIYFYYDTDYSNFSLGRFSLYEQIKLAKEYGLEWVYLGYYVKECPSLNYKANYKPYQILKNEPNLNEQAIWE